MKAAELIPGNHYLCKGRVMLYRQRIGDEYHFHCDDYAGLEGPSDPGRCHMTAAYVAEHVTPFPQPITGSQSNVVKPSSAPSRSSSDAGE